MNGENGKMFKKKSFARFFATQILYLYFFGEEQENNIEDLINFLEDYYICDEFYNPDNESEYKNRVNIDFLRMLLMGTVEHIKDIDVILGKEIIGKYSFDNIDNLIKILLRLAMYELRYTDTDRKVIINEYVDIAAEYFDEKAVSFVNATLDKLHEA